MRIIVVGATGLVGREILKILSEINFPFENISVAASAKSENTTLQYGKNQQLIVQDIKKVDFSKYNIALFSAGSAVSEIYAPIAIKSGCKVIDNTSYFRMHDDIPLVVPEINPHLIKTSSLIANPNCSTIQAVLPLQPLHMLFNLQETVFSTYQAAGGAGQKGIAELTQQTKCILNNKQISSKIFPKQLSFNVIPQIDSFPMDLDYSKEEWKMINETKKILNLPNLNITATCVRVPVIIGHSVSVYAKFQKKIDLNSAKKELQNFPGITFIDGYTTPIDLGNSDSVLVSRVRKHPTIDNAISFWCVANNIRKGAALNAVQIMQRM